MEVGLSAGQARETFEHDNRKRSLGSVYCILLENVQIFWVLFAISSAKKKSKAIKEDMKKPYKEALQRKFFTATLSKFCRHNPLALHTSVFWPYSRKGNLFRIKNYFRKLSWLSRLVFWSCQERPKECCISGDKELGPGHSETWLWHFSFSANTNMISEKDKTF